MQVYRITLTRFAGRLKASGRAARWNINDTFAIYTAGSRALACLENLVHRSGEGLNDAFSLMTIEIPERIKPEVVSLESLPEDWDEYENMPVTQRLGNAWLRNSNSAVLQVPSSIIGDEVNFLLNPAHADFELIRLLKVEPFSFDKRLV